MTSSFKGDESTVDVVIKGLNATNMVLYGMVFSFAVYVVSRYLIYNQHAKLRYMKSFYCLTLLLSFNKCLYFTALLSGC